MFTQLYQKSLERRKSKANTLLKDKKRLGKLLNNAEQKANKRPGRLKKAWKELQTFLRLLKAWWKGEYKSIPWRVLLSIVAAILYFINPFDLIPDFIPFFGWLDDTSIILFCWKLFRKDIEKFKMWEATHK